MAAAMIVLRAEAHTGMSFADLIDTNCKAPIHFKRSKVAQQVPDSEALLSTLANLELLIAFLNETRPISQGEVEILRNDYIGQVVSQMLQDEDSFGQASLAPSFLSLPENECKLHMRSIDNDLDAQIKIVETACRTFFVTGITPAPYYALRISIILSKSKLANQESAFLANWCRHFGQVPGGTFEALVNRARKRRNPV